MAGPGYIELHARSAFSFLRGASLPETLVERAAELGLPALGICDRMGVYGAPRQSGQGQLTGVRAIHGVELAMEDGSVLPVLVENRAGYRNLCELLSRAHLRAPKGQARIRWGELPEFAGGLIALTGDEEGPLARAFLLGDPGATSSGRASGPAGPEVVIRRLRETFGPGNLYVELQRHQARGEDRLNHRLVAVAQARNLPLLSTNGVLHATADGRRVLDVFTCLRHHTTLDQAGAHLSLNAARQLRGAAEMQALFADLPEAVANSVRLGNRLAFGLQDLGYEFPRFPVGPGETMEGVLREWTLRGARGRYPNGVPDRVSTLLEKELGLINRLGFAGYFLIVADLVRFCRDEGILVQGRGSAANSAVCFCLGITAVDPVRFNVLFERFLSEGRKGWPDIDLDLPSGDRRERVIQEVYRRYGPHGAAMTATVITYRGRSSAREIGKVLGLPVDVLDRFSALFASGDFPHTIDLLAQMETAGLPRTHPRAPAFADLYRQVSRLPRHLGQHTGGMIVCQDALHRVVPLENAAMPGRVVVQWDKDDCEDLGIIKVDLLGLGMMSALQDMVSLTKERGRPIDLAHLPADDPATYAMLCRADTVGVFQVESRAQMATLPRLKPCCFYDLVVEVAIIRPGPIQGDLAHPYLRRRDGTELVTYWDEKLRPVLERTLGIPLFQEQMLQIAMVMANFTGDEAEELRKALSFHRSDERMRRTQQRLKEAMDRAGIRPEVGEQVARAVGSFALYGFPESHAISFAHLAYASAYLKCHRPAEFYCALLNNQPMGFYSPATVVKDARRHGLAIRPVCIARSQWLCTLGADGALRLGLRQVRGLARSRVEDCLSERDRRPFASLSDFQARTDFTAEERRILAEVGALNAFAPHRRAAMWDVARPVRPGELPWHSESGSPPAAGHLRRSPAADEAPVASPPLSDGQAPLPPMDPVERLAADYAGLALTTGSHPMALMRPSLGEDVWTAAELAQIPDRARVRIAGQVICRQRPGTAKGICFLSLEDETGIANVIVSPELFEDQRLKIVAEPFLLIEGLAQRRHGTVHVRAARIEWLDFGCLTVGESHDFR